MESFDGTVVGGIGVLVAAADWANLGERVDPDQARFLNRLAPRFDVLQTALTVDAAAGAFMIAPATDFRPRTSF